VNSRSGKIVTIVSGACDPTSQQPLGHVNVVRRADEARRAYCILAHPINSSRFAYLKLKLASREFLGHDRHGRGASTSGIGQ
jgi:hypothetical protein